MFFLTNFAQLINIHLHTGPSGSVAQPTTPPSTQAHTALGGISLYSMLIPNIGEITLYHHGLPNWAEILRAMYTLFFPVPGITGGEQELKKRLAD